MEDYNSLSIWENAIDNILDITDGGAKTGDWDAQSGTIADNTAVTWDGGGSGGTLIHMTDAGATGTYLIRVTSGSLADDDVVADNGNTITINGTPDSPLIVADCYNDDGDLDDSVTLDGFTFDATNYGIVRAPIGERHDGTRTTGFTMAYDSTNWETISPRDDYWHIEWVAIDASNMVGTNKYGVWSFEAWNQWVENCLIYDSPEYAIYTSGSVDNVYLYVNVLLGNDNGIYMSDGGNSNQWYGNTAVGNTTNGFYAADATTDVLITNCLGLANGTDFSGTYHTNSDYNGSDDATAPDNSNSIINLTAGDEITNATGGSEDVHLKSGATVIDEGVDLTTTANIDIDGRDRNAEGDIWDIGADEFVAVAAARPPHTWRHFPGGMSF